MNMIRSTTYLIYQRYRLKVLKIFGSMIKMTSANDMKNTRKVGGN